MNEAPMAELKLPKTLDLQAAAPLQSSFLVRRGTPLRVDAGAVAWLGGQCLQVLLAASALWAADGADLDFHPRSEAFVAGLRTMGVGPDTLNVRAKVPA